MAIHQKINELLISDPKISFTHKYYEWSHQEIQENWYKRLNYLWNLDKEYFFFKSINLHERYHWLYDV